MAHPVSHRSRLWMPCRSSPPPYTPLLHCAKNHRWAGSSEGQCRIPPTPLYTAPNPLHQMLSVDQGRCRRMLTAQGRIAAGPVLPQWWRSLSRGYDDSHGGCREDWSHLINGLLPARCISKQVSVARSRDNPRRLSVSKQQWSKVVCKECPTSGIRSIKEHSIT